MKGPTLVLLLILLAACEKSMPEDVTELVYASPYPPSQTFSQADQAWMKFVEQRSGGTLRIKPVWAGTLLSADHSMEELRHGLADIGLITPIYTKGGTHLIRLQAGFYSGTTTMEGQLALYRCMEASSEQFAREMTGLKGLAIQGGSLPGLITRDRPVRTLEDLRGMRVRAPTELLSVLKVLGADPVNMPMGEVYSALAKGVIDGVISSEETFSSMHFSEVTRYFTDITIPRGAYIARAISMKSWSALSPEHQQVITESIPVWEAALESQVDKSMEKGLVVADETGIEFFTLPATDQARFDSIYNEQARQNAESLSRYGIDGVAVFNHARASVNADGTVTCAGTNI